MFPRALHYIRHDLNFQVIDSFVILPRHSDYILFAHFCDVLDETLNSELDVLGSAVFNRIGPHQRQVNCFQIQKIINILDVVLSHDRNDSEVTVMFKCAFHGVHESMELDDDKFDMI